MPPPETMKVLKSVGAQVLQQLLHRLVDEIGIGPVEARVPRGRDPVAQPPREFLRRHSGMCRRHDLHQALLAGRRHRLHVVFQQPLERLLRLPFGVFGREGLDAVEGERDLEVHRLLGPQRAVVVEHGDAVGGCDEAGRTGRRHVGDEPDDRRLRRALVPRCELGVCRGGQCKREREGDRAVNAHCSMLAARPTCGGGQAPRRRVRRARARRTASRGTRRRRIPSRRRARGARRAP